MKRYKDLSQIEKNNLFKEKKERAQKNSELIKNIFDKCMEVDKDILKEAIRELSKLESVRAQKITPSLARLQKLRVLSTLVDTLHSINNMFELEAMSDEEKRNTQDALNDLLTI